MMGECFFHGYGHGILDTCEKEKHCPRRACIGIDNSRDDSDTSMVSHVM
jgi:hypothetical protein